MHRTSILIYKIIRCHWLQLLYISEFTAFKKLHDENIVIEMKSAYFYTALVVYSALIVWMQSTVTANRTCVDTKETGRLNFELLVDVLGVPGPVGPEGRKDRKMSLECKEEVE